jgi:hypothetical protein
MAWLSRQTIPCSFLFCFSQPLLGLCVCHKAAAQKLLKQLVATGGKLGVVICTTTQATLEELLLNPFVATKK